MQCSRIKKLEYWKNPIKRNPQYWQKSCVSYQTKSSVCNVSKCFQYVLSCSSQVTQITIYITLSFCFVSSKKTLYTMVLTSRRVWSPRSTVTRWKFTCQTVVKDLVFFSRVLSCRLSIPLLAIKGKVYLSSRIHTDNRIMHRHHFDGDYVMKIVEKSN